MKTGGTFAALAGGLAIVLAACRSAQPLPPPEPPPPPPEPVNLRRLQGGLEIAREALIYSRLNKSALP
jgi:hypothetical protein